ncbi:hypothetical protein [Paenibacillus woosongensis]|uniref:Uncharacterized protein n=1 Tax=Paenibacillus woosongensis TaxID=307580 RepID=A0A7X2Z561_9BACL|nr:hypothetical protein [Paenibacillus woosongensis]MUG47776.1 hypothetical protein [Paenibacillus woosongensis]
MVHSFLIEPDTYTAFSDEADLIDKCKEWGLLSDRAAKIKIFYYKGHGLNEACSIIGYVDHITAVIELANHQKHCIHPSYLKEMQAASYGVKAGDAAEAPDNKANETDSSKAAESEHEAKNEAAAAPAKEKAIPADNTNDKLPAAAEETPKASSKKAKKTKLELPEGKVKMMATVKEFTTIPNHFSDNDDEVVIYENAAVIEPEIEIGDAWSSHSATMKKTGLDIGDTITFEAKIVAKKLAKHPVRHKLNNVAKIEKQEA